MQITQSLRWWLSLFWWRTRTWNRIVAEWATTARVWSHFCFLFRTHYHEVRLLCPHCVYPLHAWPINKLYLNTIYYMHVYFTVRSLQISIVLRQLSQHISVYYFWFTMFWSILKMRRFKNLTFYANKLILYFWERA